MRKRDIDLVKSLAIFGVIVIHMFAGYVFPTGSGAWHQSLFWGTIVRGSVPMFLMCTGALLLDPEKVISGRKLFGKHLLKTVLVMVIWAGAYQVQDMILTGEFGFARIWDGIKRIIVYQHPYHFYYLYILILFYFCLPVIKTYVAAANKRMLEYTFCIWIVVGLIFPFMDMFYPFSLVQGYPRLWALNGCYACLGYPILGYYLRKYPLGKRLSAALLLLGFAATYGGTWLVTTVNGTDFFLFLDGTFPGVAMMAAGIFCLCGKAKLPAPMEKVTEFLSGSTLCVFLVHVMFIDFLTRHNIVVTLMPPFLSIPLLSLLVLTMSLVVYIILKQIPVLKKWLI